MNEEIKNDIEAEPAEAIELSEGDLEQVAGGAAGDHFKKIADKIVATST